jgi:RNA-directed DNA polymerase
MSQEVHVRICESLRVRLPWATRLVICCQYQRDAERIKVALGRRLAEYGLKMNEDKTKLVKFSKRKKQYGESQQTFDFLGFTFYIGKSRKGYYLIKVKTAGKRFRSKLKKVNDWARTIRNKVTLKQIMKIAAAKTRGHIQYYGISHNYATVNTFINKVIRILFKWLNRRSQRKSFEWKQFELFLDRTAFPKAKICHKLF